MNIFNGRFQLIYRKFLSGNEVDVFAEPVIRDKKFFDGRAAVK